jgi:hypothetical protein
MDPFEKVSRLFRTEASFLAATWEEPPKRPDAAPLQVVISPWYGSAVPYFSTFLALGALRRGHAVSLVFNDIPFPMPSPGFSRAAEMILWALKPLEPILSPVFSSDFPIKPQEGLDDAITLAAREDFKHRQGTFNRWLDRDAHMAVALPTLREMAGRYGACLEATGPAVVLLPGGVALGTALLADVARSRGARVPTYDAGVATFAGRDAPASQFWDGPSAVETMMGDASADTLSRIREEADAMIGAAVSGKHPMFDLPFQTIDTGSPFDVVMAVSTEYDTTNLAHSNLFASQAEWVATTAVELERRRPGTRVAVRLHPRERAHPRIYSVRVREVLDGLADCPPGLVVFPPENDTNTYDLIRASRVLVTSGSSVALDAAMMGVPVVTVMNSYVSDKRSRVAAFPINREHYFDLLCSYLDRETPARFVPKAAPYLYHARMRGMALRPPANPQPTVFGDFLEGGGDLAGFLAHPDTTILLDAICDDVNPVLAKQRQALSLRSIL